MSDKNFVKGLFVKRQQNAPSFVIVNLGVKVDEFILWLRENQGGEFVNIDIKLSKAGDKYYAELNTYNPADKHYPNQNVEENQSQLNNLDVEKEIEYPESDLKPEEIEIIQNARNAHNKRVDEANTVSADEIPW